MLPGCAFSIRASPAGILAGPRVVQQLTRFALHERALDEEFLRRVHAGAEEDLALVAIADQSRELQAGQHALDFRARQQLPGERRRIAQAVLQRHVLHAVEVAARGQHQVAGIARTGFGQ
jgi:hypothetical protein